MILSLSLHPSLRNVVFFRNYSLSVFIYLLVLVSCGCCNTLPQSRRLERQKCMPSQFWSPEVWNQVVSEAVLPPELKEKSVPRLVQLLVAVCILWLVALSFQYLSLSSRYLPLFCLSVSFCLSLIKTLVIGFRAHPDYLGLSSHFKILNYYICKDPLSRQGKIHRFWGLGSGHIF